MMLLLVGCTRAGTPAQPPAATADAGTLDGSCEASTVQPWEGGWLVGDNETDGHLFRYDATFHRLADLPLAAPIEDVEAMAVDGARLAVTGSYSRNKKGEVQPERARTLLPDGVLRTVRFDACVACVAAAALAPDAGGLDVEGMAWLSDTLWLGLRSPLVDGKALLVPVQGETGGTPIPVDLGGDGVREMIPWSGGLLVVSGPVGDAGRPHALWFLAGPEATPQRLDTTLPPATEGIAVDGDRLLYVTDGDGKRGRCATPARYGHVPLPRR